MKLKRLEEMSILRESKREIVPGKDEVLKPKIQLRFRDY